MPSRSRLAGRGRHKPGKPLALHPQRQAAARAPDSGSLCAKPALAQGSLARGALALPLYTEVKITQYALVAFQRRGQIMGKTATARAVPTTVNASVRKYLTEAEVERLIAAAKHQWPLRPS